MNLALAALAAVVLVGAFLYCNYLPLPNRFVRRVSSRGLVHCVRAEYLKPGTNGGQHLQGRRCWLLFLLGPVVCCYARRRPPWWERVSGGGGEPSATVILRPDHAQAWLAESRVWFRLADRAVAVRADYDGPATVEPV